MILTISLLSISLIAEYVILTLIHKRKRDKQMASICAARLLRKPQVSEPPDPQINTVLQQMNNEYQKLLAQNPGIWIGQQSNFVNMIGRGMGNSQGLDQSQLGNNSVLPGILGKL